jgi:signal transduction histidine kinase
MAHERTVGSTSDSSFANLFAGGGEMGAIMRSTDWSKTRLGAVGSWPRSLRTMLGVVLGSRFPMLLWWGPDLLHLYNDAYRPILRDKHPASLAAPAAEVWAEVWDVAGPMARGVQQGGPATWTEDLQLFIASGSMAEETYFTFSYSPVPGDDGGVGGLLNTVQETTAKVQSERQIRMLHDLAARAAEAKSENEAYRIAAEVLSANELDLPFVLLYVLNDKADAAQLVATSGWADYDGRAKPAHVPVNDAGAASWPFAQAIRTAQEVVVDDLASRFGPLPMGRWNARPERAIVLPLSRAGQSMTHAFLVAGISPHRALDDRYRAFFRATADQVANVMANARAYDAEKKRAEALAEIDRAKTDFFSNVSHEFRTPLTLILGPVEAAMAQPEASLSGDDLKAVHRSSIRLLRLVNSLLDFTRIEAGRLQLSFEPTDLSRLTTELASAFDSLVERARLKLVVNCPTLPEPIYVDRSQWEKIVLNLISNAFKFTFEGEIEVSLSWRDDHAELCVRDTGTGIPAQELPHIFERFYRVPQAQGRSFEGTGIGLALVQELVKLHGGSVRAQSVEGQGTTFVVSIPAGTAHLPADQIVREHELMPPAAKASSYVLEATQWLPRDDAKRPPADHPVEHRPAPAESGRILVVDDNADMREYLSRLLRPFWEVEAVGDGQAVLASVRVRPPDLILSDVMMPGLNGFALLRQLRSDSKTRTVPVLLLSARAGEEAVLEGLDQGADDYLAKPFTAQELHARVRTHLTMARARNALNAELARANEDLEAFSYSVAHDLRAPLRSIDGFGSLLLSEHGAALDDGARKLLERVRAAARRMSQMVDDLLMLSRVARTEPLRAPVDLSALARESLEKLRLQEPHRSVRVELAPGLITRGDPGLLRIALENLLGNAWKYSGRTQEALIEFGAQREPEEKGESVYFVRDNGAGFDMQYASKLFTAFQRLHRPDEFPGTGIGLATVQRIVRKHGGRIWAQAAAGEGATFYFTLS